MRTSITSRDWGRYPILRFAHVPASVEVDVIDRPGAPFLGTGEAVAGARGRGVGECAWPRCDRHQDREIPFDPPRVRAALALYTNP
jgi:CO/xanthine dehydrogenase Mo-binding subunit